MGEALPLALRGAEAGPAAFAVGVEPAPDGAAVDAEVGGDVLAFSPLVGRQDDLEAVPELAILGGAELRG